VSETDDCGLSRDFASVGCRHEALQSFADGPPGTFAPEDHRRSPKRHIRDWFRVIECAHFHARDCWFDQMAFTTLGYEHATPVWQLTPAASTLSRFRCGAPPIEATLPRDATLSDLGLDLARKEEMLRPNTLQTTD